MDRDYSFPLRPYNVQIDFMNNLYECLSNCKGGIFESPTGTGKTLSIICASLTFLFDYHEGLLTDILNPNNSKKFKHDFSGKTIKDLQTMILSNCPILFPKKILYLTRTHSQLDQFVGELKKTKWASTEKVRVVRLGSRSQFCIHETVSKNKNLIEFNCKRMTKFVDPDQSEEENNEEEKKIQNYSIFGNFPTKVKKKIKKNPNQCEYFLQQDNMKQFLLDNVCDIEDLVTAGHRLMGCPYFGTRSAIKEADLILAPYSSVFNKHTRHSVGIDLKDCFVIVDESHNINQAITDMHSASISKKQLINSEKSIKAYYTAFVDGMNPRKLMFVKKAIKIVEKLKGFIRTNENLTNKTEERDSFLRSLEIDDIDFFYLWDFFEEDELAAKIFNHCERDRSEHRPDLASLKAFVEFILCLNEPFGVLLLSNTPEKWDSTLKFLLLDPVHKFEKMLSESMCVVLCGGTLTPTQEYLNLFSMLSPSQFIEFHCGHVIPSENLLLATISRSQNNQEFKFVYQNRENKALFLELAQIIADISCVVPNGMVVFVPSYAVLSKFQSEEMISKVSVRKPIFFDSKDENVLKDFAEAAEKGGAILFAVVRGSLSEGINFSDKLGRCVILIGMPYLNKNDLEVSVKMNFLDRKRAGLSGQDFYDNSCQIAINQSIGRAIRHEKDFAAIILIDSRHYVCRFKRPAWMMRSFIEPITNRELLSNIRNFFRSKINLK